MEEDELNIFKGMEGFEDVRNSDDSVLVALLDELQEETLMTLLSDDLFAKELRSSPFEGEIEYDISCSEESSPIADSIIQDQVNSGSKRERCNSAPSDTIKRRKVDTSPFSHVLDHEKALRAVMHDHCYALTFEERLTNTNCHEETCEDHLSSTNSDEETSNEEGNSSDTGRNGSIASECMLGLLFVHLMVISYKSLGPNI